MQQKILRIADAVQKTGLSRSTIYRLLEAEDFPEPIRLSKRAIGWTEEQLNGWISSRTHVSQGVIHG
ncbi:MAG TPA: AlpA family phage regulatory protein [Novimethylophilus sp.]|uniref:helix-turn-helix transcriptional regulator n=1 Tax=Novimethylophilus sp. TaxID=2137426 RepID=UPI002F422AC0